MEKEVAQGLDFLMGLRWVTEVKIPRNQHASQPALPGVSPAPTLPVELLLELRNRKLLVFPLLTAGIDEVSLLVFLSCDVTESTANK